MKESSRAPFALEHFVIDILTLQRVKCGRGPLNNHGIERELRMTWLHASAWIESALRDDNEVRDVWNLVGLLHQEQRREFIVGSGVWLEHLKQMERGPIEIQPHVHDLTCS